jgi:DNA helicase-2/ATP-dependent DNA helicase PcrA
MTRARRRLVLTGAARRRWYGDYRASAPSRFIDEVPDELMERAEPRVPSFFQQAPGGGAAYGASPYRRGRGGPDRFREEQPAYRYEDEDQSRPGLEQGMRVRHAQFGVGTVLSVEPVDGDAKLVVRFAAVGTKRLLAKYAKLEVV